MKMRPGGPTPQIRGSVEVRLMDEDLDDIQELVRYCSRVVTPPWPAQGGILLISYIIYVSSLFSLMTSRPCCFTTQVDY